MPLQYSEKLINDVGALVKEVEAAVKEAGPLLDKAGGLYHMNEASVVDSGLKKAQVEHLLDLHKKNEATMARIEQIKAQFTRSLNGAYEEAKEELKKSMAELKRDREKALAQLGKATTSAKHLLSGGSEQALKKALPQLH